MKKTEVAKTSEQSGLEAESIRSRIFCIFTLAIDIDICDLTNAGRKKIDETISVTATGYLFQHCACKFAVHRDKAFISSFSNK